MPQSATINEPVPVSVVIPAYNRADLVGRAIRSALSQRPSPPAEIIVVDDCSSDATGDEARKFGVTVIRHDVNRGEAGARNSGMEAAQHDWVAFLDSDDEWLPEHLATLWPRRNGHVAVSSTALYRSDERLRVLGHPKSQPVSLVSPAQLVFPSNPVPLSGVVADNRVLLSLGGFRPLKTGADLDMWIRALQAGTLLACPEPGYIYHLHDGQVSSDAELMRGDLLRLLESYRSEPWCSPALIGRVAVVNAWDTLQAALRGGDGARARRTARWILASPVRLRALGELWIWRFRLRRRARHFCDPDSFSIE